MRWSAQDVVAAALGERMLEPDAGGAAGSAEALAAAAAVRREDIAFLPATDAEMADELDLARLAAVIAARRHARPGTEGARDLTHVGLLIGSGGVLRHADPAAALEVLGHVLSDYSGGWRLPERARMIIDHQYLLAPIGLLQMTGRPAVARALAHQLTSPAPPPPPARPHGPVR
jgi:hypothetical protein